MGDARRRMKTLTERIAEARAWFDGPARVALIEEEGAVLRGPVFESPSRGRARKLAAEILLDCARLRLSWVVVYVGPANGLRSHDSDWFWRAAEDVRGEWRRSGHRRRFGVKQVPLPSAALAACYATPPPGPAVVRVVGCRADAADFARRWPALLGPEISVLYVYPTLRDHLVHHVLSRPLILNDEDDRALIRLLPEPLVTWTITGSHV